MAARAWATPRLTQLVASAGSMAGTREGITENGHASANIFKTVHGGTGNIKVSVKYAKNLGAGAPIAPFGSP